MREETEVVPLRPGFDNEFRGFNRNQVIEHIELLEDQIKMLTMDRDEAARLNEDQRRITDHTRRQLEETAAALERLQNSDTGLPHATQRMQNMLMMADEEARTIRDHARREADTIRGTANTDAAQIRQEAETMATALRDECAELVNDLQQQRERLDEHHAARLAEVDSERRALQRSIKESYDQAMATAQQEADELLRQTQQRCEEMESASTRYHNQVVEDLDQRAVSLERLRESIVESLESINRFSASAQSSIVDVPKPEGMRVEQPAHDTSNGHQASADHNGHAHAYAPSDLDIPVQADSEQTLENLPQANGRYARPAGPLPEHAARQASAAGNGSAHSVEEGN